MERASICSRRAFLDSGILPEDLLMREKAAFSDAVGHSMVDYLKEYADSCYSDSEFSSKAASFDFCPPFTRNLSCTGRFLSVTILARRK